MAGRIPQQFIQELLAQTDIAELIRQHVPLKRAGNEYKACCPFHNEKTPSFTVSPAKGFYYCFGCGASGNAIGFLIDYAHYGYVDAVEELATRLGRTVPREGGDRDPEPDREPLREVMERACRYFQQELKKSKEAKEYARSRGLSGEICRDYGIGFAPPGFDNLVGELGKKYSEDLLLKAGLLGRKEKRTYDRFRNRLMFPIRDFRGRVLGFGGRCIDPEDQPKYLNSPETPLFQKRRILYGVHEMQKRRTRADQVVLTEGYMDVVVLAQHGVGNALATLGTATTEEHIRQLGRFCRKYVFCFDGDRAGRAAGWKALENLLEVFQDGDEIRFAHLPEGEDPDSYVRAHGAEGWEKLLETATPLEEYFFAHLEEGHDTSQASGRAALVKEARPLLARLRAPIFRELLTHELEDRVGLDRGSLRQGRAQEDQGDSRRRTTISRKGRPSVVRRMIRILMEFPELAREVSRLPALELSEPISNLGILESLDLPGYALLAEMVRFIEEHPEATLGGIVEHFRGREEQRHLERLKTWIPLQLTPDGQGELQAEDLAGGFQEDLRWVQKKYILQELDKLFRQEKEGLFDEAQKMRRKELKGARALLEGAAG